MNKSSNILKIALFATGLSGIVAEYVLSTLATYFLGDSVFQFTMIVSIMLFSMGLGSRFSKSIDDNLLIKFILLEFSLSILTSFVSLITYWSATYYSLTGVVIYSMSILIGLLIGMEIPIAVRLNDKFESLKVNVSSILENDYYGSLLGGVFFAFIGLPYLGLAHTPFILGTINLLVAFGLLFTLRKEIKINRLKSLITLGLAVTATIALGSIFVEKVISYGESQRYKDRVVFEEQTKYQKIVITKSNSDFWLFINGNQQMSTIDEVMYHEPLVHPAMMYTKAPKNILVLGGGDGAAVREILKYSSVNDITLVDLDPVITELGKTNSLLTEMNGNALNNEKVNIINTDAFTFIEKNTSYYDVIIIDLPDPKTIELGRMYSMEFYTMCYKRLRPNGAIVTQAGSPYYANKAFQCINKSMMSGGFTTAPIHNQVITLGEWGWIIGVKNTKENTTLKKRLQSLTFNHIETQWINNESMGLITSFGKNVFIKDTTEVIEINKVHNPVLYKYYLNGDWDIY